ncbi:PAS domain-containing protein [Caulobacter sp. NIBR1757]|uniref:hybrid sensor histidine kinase/response regulator n=1 Tax=Caulobacter sp. NIBR1757 TaxID=3016000 RepID=UPI0022EFE110|nr:PAS domain-containing protein [Caulobacter sp. NIBR1757]WGM38191.1 Sensor histidine kinase RcsC [Caulobacter sp. NIBR1757]
MGRFALNPFGPDAEPILWRVIPQRPPSIASAAAVTAAAFLVAFGLRLVLAGAHNAFNASSSYFPVFIIATLYAGQRWGWGVLLLALAMGVLAPFGATRAADGILILFGLSGAVTILVAAAARAALVRMRAETQARTEAEGRLKLAESAGGLGLWDWNLETNVGTWSSGVYHNLGIAPRNGPRVYADLMAAIHPDDRERVTAANRAAFKSAQVYQIEYRTIGDDGQERWIHARGQVHRDPSGRACRVVGYNLDVTERHRAAEQIRESEARFRALADSAPALLWVSMPGGAREFVNLAYVEFAGEGYEAALHLDWRTRLHPEDLNRVLREQAAGEASLKPFELEARYRRADGEWRWLRSFSQPRLSPGGDVAGLAGIAFDVTDAKQVEADLQRLNDLLTERVEEAMAQRDQAQAALIQSQKLEALGQLTGGVAHDFNNLLTVIIGALDIVQRHPADATRTERLAKAALDAAQRGERLTRQLLAFSRRQPLRNEVLAIDATIKDSAQLYSRALGERYMLDLDLAAPEARVLIDPAQLDAALMNLLVNARDAMEGGGVITLSSHIADRCIGETLPGPCLCISVRDGGVGMDPATVARVFEPFFSTKPVGKGTGLGLSQVYGFASQSGGGAEIESRPGEGTTVSIFLPLTNDAETRVEPEARPADARPLHVLLVEDDPEVADLAQAMLRELGHRITFADTVETALAALRAVPDLDLLLTDVVMPGPRNGVDLAREAAALRPGLPILLTSGYTGEALDDAEAAPWPLLRKPYTLDVLARTLAAHARPAGVEDEYV